MKVHIHSYSTLSDYSKTARTNTGYIRPGYSDWKERKDTIFKETSDYIAQANYQRKRISTAILNGAKVLPCL